MIIKKIIPVYLATALFFSPFFNDAFAADYEDSYQQGLDAITSKDFKSASRIFSGLSKDGDAGAMNNLGVALMMVDRKDEAIYWFGKATQYGDANAPITLRNMGETVPAADLVGKHPSQVQQEQKEQEEIGLFVASILVGALIGVSLHNAGRVYKPSVQNRPPKIPNNAISGQRPGTQNHLPQMPMENNFFNAQNQITNISYSNGISGQRIGNMTFYSNGLSSQTNGSLTTFSNGQSAIQSGGSTFYSNGVSSQQSGSSTLFSNGQVCQLIGSILSCN